MANNISNSNYYSVSSYTNKGMSGMISGMDTENMVKQMLSGTQKKIDKQNALKQQTLWRQEFYREIITSINSVRNKYFNSAFDASPVNNLSNSKFFNSMVSSVTSGSAVKVISTAAGANPGEMRISVEQLAEAASLSSAKAVGAGDSITAATALSESMLASFEKKLVLNVGATTVDVDLNGVSSQSEMLDRINNALQAKGTGATAKVFDNKLRIISAHSADTISVGVASTELALKMTGLSAGRSSSKLETDGTQMLQSGSNISPGAGVSFTVNLDGVEKQITLNPAADSDGKITKEAVRDSLQAELNRTFGNYVDVSLEDGDKIKLKMNFGGEVGHSLTIYGMESAKLGIAAGTSSRLTTASKLSDIEGLTGERFAFTINGKEFTFSKDDTIGSMINKINSGNAGVQISFSSVSNMFKLSATATGSQFGIDIQQTEGNLFGKLFQTESGDSMFNAGNSVASGELTVSSIQGKSLSTAYTAASGASFKINVNGKDYSFSLGQRDKEYTSTEVMGLLNNWLKDKFGTNSDSQQNIEFKDGKLEIRDGSVVKFAQSSVDTENADTLKKEEKSDIALALGLTITAKSNVATADTKVSEIYQLKDIYGEFQDGDGAAAGADTTLAQLASYQGATGAQGKISFSQGRLSLTAENAGDSIDLSGVEALFGPGSLNYADGKIIDENTIKAGKDAIVTINDVQTTRSSNTFTVDGITIQATAKSPDGEETVIGTSRDTEAIVEGVKSFIEDYNAMIEKLTGYTKAEATYKDYAPLTDEQKKEMSEKEIELWEEKAKSGLLRRDATLTSFLNDLYATLYNRPLASAFALYDIGIESTNYKEPGKLYFDETKLREALSADPGSVEALFTNSVNGIAKQMSTLMDNAARVSVANPGSLVTMAGMKGSATDANNILNDNLTRINDKLKELQDKYEKERARYWKQFNDMERVLANYQSQSAYISQQFGGGYY
ncbi:MAG: flagellar filament capping protein FliD [Clostridiales bacterium]